MSYGLKKKKRKRRQVQSTRAVAVPDEYNATSAHLSRSRLARGCFALVVTRQSQGELWVMSGCFPCLHHGEVLQFPPLLSITKQSSPQHNNSRNKLRPAKVQRMYNPGGSGGDDWVSEWGMRDYRILWQIFCQSDGRAAGRSDALHVPSKLMSDQLAVNKTTFQKLLPELVSHILYKWLLWIHSTKAKTNTDSKKTQLTLRYLLSVKCQNQRRYCTLLQLTVTLKQPPLEHESICDLKLRWSASYSNSRAGFLILCSGAVVGNGCGALQ